jgi:hypothetical protein
MAYRSFSFVTTDYHFTWTADWYTWDGKAAKKAAMAERNAEAKRLRAEGWTVRCGSQASLMSKGGIGSGHPHIELWATAYTLSATRDDAAHVESF